jgi:hypothetical protein
MGPLAEVRNPMKALLSRPVPPAVRAPLVVALGLLAAAGAALRFEGRVWVCAYGDVGLWAGDAWGPHNSQHLLDPYSFTHVSHGLALWGAVWLLARRVPAAWRAVAALGAEALWEVVENSAWVIDRYRAATAAIGYTGDTVVNSLGDVATCGLGLVLAQRLGWRRSAVVFVALELVLLVWIRDGLVLNVVMLLFPIEAIRRWQLGH